MKRKLTALAVLALTHTLATAAPFKQQITEGRCQLVFVK
jgi:hypothetical protein